MLFIHKINTTNTLTLKSEEATASQKIYTSNRQDLAFGAGQYGGVILICVEDGGVFKWHQLDSNGLIANGTAVLPSLAFASDPDTGIYLSAPNKLGVTTAGVDRLTVSSLYVSSLMPHLFQDGTLLAPGIAFENSVTTGFLRDSNGYITASIGGLKALAIRPSGIESDTAVSFLNSSSGFQKILANGLLTSDNFADNTLIPTNGIYSKGNVLTGGQFLGTATSALYADLA